MKTIQLEFRNKNGAVMKGDIINLDEGDRLVLQPPEDVTMEEMHGLFNHVKSVLQGKNEVMVIPNNIRMMILKIT